MLNDASRPVEAEPAALPPNEDQIRAREELILGGPPRIAPMDVDEIDEEALTVVSDLRDTFKRGPKKPDEFFAITLQHPKLYRRHTDLALQLMNHGALRPRDRELIILRTGWLCQAPYEWGEHVIVSKQFAGMTRDDIERVTIGSTAPGWNARDRTILQAVEELHAMAMVCDETWNRLAAELDERQLLELPVLVGQYKGVAYLQNSVRIRLGKNNVGLRAR
jgi:alkylhydroperoxidase family enzyme